MSNSRNILATAILAASLALPVAAHAELLENVWEPVEVIVPNDPENPCGSATFFYLEGMVHRKRSTLQNGVEAININVMGTFTPVDGPNAGESSLFRQNAHEVLPQFQDLDNAVYSVGDFIRIISPGRAENYKAHYNFHIVIMDGEVKSLFEIDKVTCS
jgi:hypothetical protein